MINFTKSQSNTTTTNHSSLKIAMFTSAIAAILLEIPSTILIICAVRNRKEMQNARNYFIVSLACSDIVSLLISVLFSTLNFGNVLPYMTKAVCKTFMPTGGIVAIISVYTHVAIALERRRAIVFPLLPKPSPRRIKTFIAIIWLVPVLIIAPIYYQIDKELLGHSCKFNIMNGPEEAYLKVFVLTGMASIFVIPFGVLTLSYQQIIRTLKQNTASIKDLVETNAVVALRLKNQRKVVNCLITLVCAFVVLTFPFNFATILVVFIKTLESYFTFTFSVITLCIYFMIFLLNPLILCVSSTEFRVAFNETLEYWQNFFCRMFFCFNKSKSLTSEPSKTSPVVITLAILNKVCEDN